MYGVAGERRLTELELDWLPGYGSAKPVRTGNAAHEQLQLDVYGELADVLWQGVRADMPLSDEQWSLLRLLLEITRGRWSEPDEGIWEVRGPRRHFTHSKVMCWVAFDRALAIAERDGLRRPARQVAQRSATRSTTRCASTRTTPRSARSRRPTTRTISTRRC